MIYSALFKSLNKFKKNSIIKKEFITFFSTFHQFSDDEKKICIKPIKYIISESKDIGNNSTECHDELLAAMIISETDNEDIIETEKVKVYVPIKNRYTKKLVELHKNIENSISEKSNS